MKPVALVVLNLLHHVWEKGSFVFVNMKNDKVRATVAPTLLLLLHLLDPIEEGPSSLSVLFRIYEKGEKQLLQKAIEQKQS